ncbi:MAG: SdrD B-like domain-containing protein, partial [Candidatus Bathyarchaeia archaeon]
MKNKNTKTKITVATLTTLLIITTILTSSTFIIPSTSGQVGIDWNTINWVLIDEDENESGGENWRDVIAAYAANDANYLYLKLKTVDPPKFPTSKDDRDDDKYRWFLDFDGNMYWQGNVLYEAEYLISVQDKDDNGMGEMYLLFDSDNDSEFDDEQWVTIVVNSTDGGFRINGYQLEIYINWSKIGGMPSVLWLSWCTDRSDNNLNQCPATDRAETAYGVVIRLGSISGYKWEDLDMDGSWDSGNEPPIQGWEIHLQSDAMSWEAYTDESGYYQFIALPEGTYIVSETIPNGWIQTYPGNNSYIVQISSGENITGKDFGNFESMASLSIRKTANATQAHVGEEIVYSFNITNTGNVPLLIENVTDNVIGSIMINQTLEPSHWIIVNATYTVKESNPDPLVNTATVYATYNSSTLSASDTWIIDILHPSIMVEKTANATEAYIGDAIQYKINVTNTGDCNLYNVNVSDSLFGNLLTNRILEPKQSIIFTKTYITENERQLTNTANASGIDPLGMRVYDEDSWTVNVSPPPPITATVTFNATGLGPDASEKIVLTVDGTSYTFSQLPLTFEWAVGSPHNFSWSSPVEVTSGKCYLWTSTSGLSGLQNGEIIVPTEGGNITGNYKSQYYLTVISPYGNPTPSSGWFDAGIEINASVTSPWPDGAVGIRHVCTGWTGTGSVPTSGTETSVTFTINEPSSITWNWKTQYLLTVGTNPPGLSPQPTRNPPGEAGPANSWWYDNSTSVTLTAQQVEGYEFNSWSVNNVNQGINVNPVTVIMDAPKTATAHYSTITPPPPPPPPPPTTATVTFSQEGIGLDSNRTVLTVDGLNYTVSQLPVTFTWNVGSSHSFNWADPVDTTTYGKRYAWNSTKGLSTLKSGTVTVPFGGGFVNATYKVQYYLEVSSEYGDTSTPSGWYDAGANITVTVTSPVQGPIGTRYVCIGWNGTGSVPSTGNETA